MVKTLMCQCQPCLVVAELRAGREVFPAAAALLVNYSEPPASRDPFRINLNMYVPVCVPLVSDRCA